MIEAMFVVVRSWVNPEFLPLTFDVVENKDLLSFTIEGVKKARRALVARGDWRAFGKPVRVYDRQAGDESLEHSEIEFGLRARSRRWHVVDSGPATEIGLPGIALPISDRGLDFALWNAAITLTAVVVQDGFDCGLCAVGCEHPGQD